MLCAVLPAVLSRVPTLFPAAPLEAAVRPLCVRLLLAAFQRCPGCVDVLQRPVMRAITCDIDSASHAELAVNMAWAVGEYGALAAPATSATTSATTSASATSARPSAAAAAARAPSTATPAAPSPTADASSSLSDAKSSLGDAKSSLGDVQPMRSAVPPSPPPTASVATDAMDALTSPPPPGQPPAHHAATSPPHTLVVSPASPAFAPASASPASATPSVDYAPQLFETLEVILMERLQRRDDAQVRSRVCERERGGPLVWTHRADGKALAFKPPPLTRMCRRTSGWSFTRLPPVWSRRQETGRSISGN
jgi:hypothetical protein